MVGKNNFFCTKMEAALNIFSENIHLQLRKNHLPAFPVLRFLPKILCLIPYLQDKFGISCSPKCKSIERLPSLVESEQCELENRCTSIIPCTKCALLRFDPVPADLWTIN